MSARDELASSVPVADTGTAGGLGGAGGVDVDQIPPAQREVPGSGGAPEASPSPFATALARVASGSALLTVLAVVIALVVGAVLIAATDANVRAAAQYFFARPGDTISALATSISGAYLALFRGGIYDYSQPTFGAGIASLLTSLNLATPLIAAGLGIAVGFRTGVFNIGGQGQVLVAAATAGWVGFAWNGPFIIHMLVATAAGLVAGGVWAGIVGVLKARTGAHEVIVTIMLNYVAYYLVDYLLHTSVLQAPGSHNPQSPAEKANAVFPALLGSNYRLNLGFVFVVLATLAAAWLLNRSSLGFKMRAVGENPRAARVAGIEVNRIVVAAMVISGVLVGLAGVYQVLGQTTTGFGNDIDAGIGFNAITVTLLGRSRPWGVFAAGIVFGVFQAGGYIMQASQGVDIDIVQIIQAVIVLFIAAPPLVRTIFRLPAPGAPRARRAPRAGRTARTARAEGAA